MALLSFLLLCLSALSISMARPLHGAGTYRTLMPRQSNGTAMPFDANQALAGGIALNVMTQQASISALQLIQQLEASPANDPSQFDVAKVSTNLLSFVIAYTYTYLLQPLQNNLMGFITLGMNIRQNNQAIAPAGNTAITNLNALALEQQSEMTMAQSLTGNPQTDAPIIQTLGRMITRAGAKTTQTQSQVN